MSLRYQFKGRLLLLAEVNADGRAGDGGPVFAGHRRQSPGCATNSNLPKTILGEFYSGRGAHRLTRLGEEAFSRLHFVQPSSSPSRVKPSLPLTTKSSSEDLNHFCLPKDVANKEP